MKAQDIKNLLISSLAISMSVGCAKVDFSPLPEADSLTGKAMSYTEVVQPGNKQVDFLIVLDDSNSMLPELQKLAAKMSAFISSIDSSEIDWQMCLTLTRPVPGANWGSPVNWQGYSPARGVPPYLLKKGTSNLDQIFNSTISQVEVGGTNSGDERAIKAAFESFTSGSPYTGRSHQCYRPGAAISIIAISDEDERSVGGDISRLKASDASDAYKPFEYEDIPENLISQAKSVFGPSLRMTFNSIVVKPGDRSCEAIQDKDRSPSHQAYVYSHLSQLTSGGVGSVCDADYSDSLYAFRDKIVNSLQQLTLRCTPVEESVKVRINGNAASNFTIHKNTLKFAQALREGTRIDLSFDCE